MIKGPEIFTNIIELKRCETEFVKINERLFIGILVEFIKISKIKKTENSV